MNEKNTKKNPGTEKTTGEKKPGTMRRTMTKKRKTGTTISTVILRKNHTVTERPTSGLDTKKGKTTTEYAIG